MGDGIAALKAAVEAAELVDGHAHNIVAVDSTFPYLSCFSGPAGEASSDAPFSINFKRNLREIAELYGTDPSLEALQEYRLRFGVESLTSRCFKAAGISAVLIDDGIDEGVYLDKRYEIDWHKQFVPFVGRILRIERVAEKILDEGIAHGVDWSLDSFTDVFLNHLKSNAGNVVCFKSIAAYYRGLEINPNVSEKDAAKGLDEILKAGSPIRILNKNLVDYIFIKSLEVAQSLGLPMQMHTGFGDYFLDLRQSNPLHLRGLLEDNRFKKSRIVLLHASYPFSREASYLASVYSQVYLDFGLAVPKLSFQGMLSSIRELLHLAPINKVMFSTDGIAFAESFYLGAKKAREVIFAVLRDTCADGDLSISEAIEAATNLLSENSKHFYKIEVSSSLK